MVSRVVDGDTIRVVIDGVEFPLRYIGIDAPEPDATDPQVKQLADLAAAANQALVGGRQVLLERDVSDVDRFDRLLRNVWIEHAGAGYLLVNLELVRQGFATATVFPPDVRYADLLASAHESARVGQIGLWAPIPTPIPTPTPAPTASPVVAVVDDPIVIESGVRERFEGRAGDYAWTSLLFLDDRVTVRWSASASSKGDCAVVWRVDPTGGSGLKSTIRVKAGASETGNRRYDTPFSGAEFVVASTCGTWKMSMEGFSASTTGGGRGNCDASYPDVCIPPYPPDLDCGDISFRRFTVRGPDPHGFDGDNDGIGCESG